ncbi:MAG: hypothetical protein ACRDWT_03825 [Jatrophihabitantaceae bacterium]
MRLPRTLAAFAVLAALLTACSTTTTGSGTAPQQPSSGSGHDFPSGSGTTPAPAATSATRTSTPTGSARPPKPLRTDTVHAADGTSFLVSIWAARTDPTCANHAYGKPVIAFLTAHPCVGLRRLLATTTLDTHAVGLAISELGFKGTDPQVYTTAGNFVTLVKRNGTGNLDDLLRDGSRLPAGPSSVPDPDVTTAQAQDAGVEVVDAWYLDRPTSSSDSKLIAMALSLFLQLN